MGEIKKFTPVKLICGLIFSDDLIREEARARLIEKFGLADAQSESFPFNFAIIMTRTWGRISKDVF
jgi:hypothetical protein